MRLPIIILSFIVSQSFAQTTTKSPINSIVAYINAMHDSCTDDGVNNVYVMKFSKDTSDNNSIATIGYIHNSFDLKKINAPYKEYIQIKSDYVLLCNYSPEQNIFLGDFKPIKLHSKNSHLITDKLLPIKKGFITRHSNKGIVIKKAGNSYTSTYYHDLYDIPDINNFTNKPTYIPVVQKLDIDSFLKGYYD